MVNPGSVGLARDVAGEACYAVCDAGQVRLKRVSYDVDRTLSLLWQAPLPAPVLAGLSRVLSGPGRPREVRA